jgi:hypothetical protein
MECLVELQCLTSPWLEPVSWGQQDRQRVIFTMLEANKGAIPDDYDCQLVSQCLSSTGMLFHPPQPVLYWWSDETIEMQNQQTFLGVMCLLPGAKQGFELLFAVSPFRLVVYWRNECRPRCCSWKCCWS